jgi:hypothetical protein
LLVGGDPATPDPGEPSDAESNNAHPIACDLRNNIERTPNENGVARSVLAPPAPPFILALNLEQTKNFVISNFARQRATLVR